eukprot:NODE_22053_length_724_cov_9.234506.p1 GENE.NODE_22053_length_724_cov_9.234506~~NODE_22053_length_724_cov_9.234506.p1  ORF type:complete len:165 (-),score=14.47 NODE_22053_length_724_cov_9.234506:119-613(-)
MWTACQPFSRGVVCGCIVISTAVERRPVWLYKVPMTLPILRELIVYGVHGFRTKQPMKTQAQKDEGTCPRTPTMALNVLDIMVVLKQQRFEAVTMPILSFASPKDPVCDIAAMNVIFSRVPRCRTVCVAPLPEEDQHCITGRLGAPSTIPFFASEISAFVTTLS